MHVSVSPEEISFENMAVADQPGTLREKLETLKLYLHSFQGKRAKAMADQLTTVSKKRFINSAGSVSSIEMKSIGKAITTQLDL